MLYKGTYGFKLQFWGAGLVFLCFLGVCFLILCGVQEILPTRSGVRMEDGWYGSQQAAS